MSHFRTEFRFRNRYKSANHPRKDCSILLPNSVLPPDSVIPPFTIFGGAPARPVGKVAESHQDHMTELTTSFYQNTKLLGQSFLNSKNNLSILFKYK